MGLASWGGDLRGPLGRTANRLAESIEPRRQPVRRPGGRHRESSATVSCAGHGRHSLGPATIGARIAITQCAILKEMRSAISLAVLYPLLVAMVAYFLFAILIVYVLPQVLLLYDGAPPRFWLAVEGLSRFFQGELDLPGVGLSLPLVLIPPAVVAAAVALWWLRMRCAVLLDAGAASRWLGWIPVAGLSARCPRRHAGRSHGAVGRTRRAAG